MTSVRCNQGGGSTKLTSESPIATPARAAGFTWPIASRILWPAFLLATTIAAQTILAAVGSAQGKPETLAQEIAEIEAQIDAIEADAIAGIASLLAGSPQRTPALGKILFFDKQLSVNQQRGMCVLPYAANGLPGRIRKPQSRRRRNARLGANALRSSQASKRSLCHVLAASLLRR